MNKKFLFLLLLISLIESKKSFGDKLREKTDKKIFGKDPEKRSVVQAATRDAVHGVWHSASAIKKYIKGDKEAARHDVQRAKDHFSGENVKQIRRKHGGKSGKF